jgi:hypothetical protein
MDFQKKRWKVIGGLSMTEEEEILTDFFKKLAENQEPLGEDFERVFWDNYWELLG